MPLMDVKEIPDLWYLNKLHSKLDIYKWHINVFQRNIQSI